MFDDTFDKLFAKRACRILTDMEVVDFAFARLVIEDRLEWARPVVVRLLEEKLGDEVKS